MRQITITVITIILMMTISCTRTDEFPVGRVLICDAEAVKKSGKKFVATNDSSAFFDGGKKQTKKESLSGRYSVYTLPGNKAFAFGHTIKRAGPDWYFRVSVWRKSKDGKGVIVGAGKDVKLLYLASSVPVEYNEYGWEKLVLDVYTPPLFFNDEVIFYAWNNGSDTIYFDDFKIERISSKQYPAYLEDPLNIYMDTSDYIHIYEKRKQAFKDGVLQTSDDDWVKAIVFRDDEMMKARLRLKGDWLDHLRANKWSYRIKMRKNYAWNRLRTFSVQTPASREYLYEWLAHQFFIEADVLTTRYGFIPLNFNGEPRGMYAWEEHFEKQLLEFRDRREGPIVKFTEDAFWQIQKINIRNENWANLPFYEAAVIQPFKANKTVKSPSLFNQFLNAQKLMNQYKNHLRPIEEIFDVDKLASYYAMLDLTQARHGMVWHNQRIYFNPVLCKLEPIAFDCYSSDADYNFNLKGNLAYIALSTNWEIAPEQFLFYDMFKNRNFLDRYISYLEKYSNKDFVSGIIGSLSTHINSYDSLLKLEFPNCHFDAQFYSKSALGIRNYLPELKKYIDLKIADTTHQFKVKKNKFSVEEDFGKTPQFFVHAYKQSTNGDSVKIKIENFYPKKLVILGTGRKDKYVNAFQHPEPEIEAFDGSVNRELIISSDTSSRFLFYLIEDQIATYTIPIYQWPKPKGITPQQEITGRINLMDYNIIDRISGRDIFIRTGEIRVDYPVVFPEGYKIHFKPGTKIDMVDSAMFLSYSPISINGNQREPVVITSSDFSAMGFTVLQADEASVVDHVLFENLNTLDYKGWTLTGAVTFYESDVTITNTRFYRNQCEDALNTIRSEFTVDNCEFDYIFGDAFDSDFCTGVVSNTLFKNVGNDAIDFSGSNININNVLAEDINDKGISGGEESFLTVSNTIIKREGIGLAYKYL